VTLWRYFGGLEAFSAPSRPSRPETPLYTFPSFPAYLISFFTANGAIPGNGMFVMFLRSLRRSVRQLCRAKDFPGIPLDATTAVSPGPPEQWRRDWRGWNTQEDQKADDPKS